MSPITWILVADSARARLFESERRNEPLRELATFINPEARMSGSQITTDRPPSVDESMGPARHVIQPHTNLRDKQAERFARELAAVCGQGHAKRQFERLVLAAPARFLGKLRSSLDTSVRDCIAGTVGLDLVRLRDAEIHERVVQWLEATPLRRGSGGSR
jgi:protein required for attachment to host cells